MEIARFSIKPVAGVILVGAAVLLIGYSIRYIGTMTVRVCQNPSHPVRTTPGTISNFPVQYQTARQAFTKAVTVNGGHLESIQNPNMGPSGEPLFMDVALFGDTDSKRMLVVSSGTHGVEGFAGSGIQTKLLKEGLVSELPSGVSLLMIHGINPYGMAHLRRFNEDNVDLNQNFRDHSKPIDMPNTDYEVLSDAIAPNSISFWPEVKSWPKVLWFKWTAGRQRLQAAVEGGQYSDPIGLFYGGTFETWSNVTIRSIINKYLEDSDKAIFIDLHTGLGEYSAAKIILNKCIESDEFKRALDIWGDKLVVSTAGGHAFATHLDASLKLALSNMLSSRMEVTAVSLEFGTLPIMEVFTALRAENWLHQYGGREHPRTREIKECLLRAFHPGTQEWEATIWEKGKDVIERALVYLM